MNRVYILRHSPHTLHAEDDDIIVGIYTDVYDAIDAGRKLMMHDDDEYSVILHQLNCVHPGESVWSRDADEGHEWALDAYQKHWPRGTMPSYGHLKST